MNKLLLRTFMMLNTFLIHVSNGKIGGQLGKQTIMIMHTVGRKTGKKYSTPIAYFKTDKGYFVIASNWGQERNASWYYSIKQQPDLTVEVNGLTIPVHANEVEGSEYERLWDIAVSHHPDYLHYKEMTSRHIPIILFEIKNSRL